MFFTARKSVCRKVSVTHEIFFFFLPLHDKGWEKECLTVFTLLDTHHRYHHECMHSSGTLLVGDNWQINSYWLKLASDTFRKAKPCAWLLVKEDAVSTMSQHHFPSPFCLPFLATAAAAAVGALFLYWRKRNRNSIKARMARLFLGWGKRAPLRLATQMPHEFAVVLFIAKNTDTQYAIELERRGKMSQLIFLQLLFI